MENPSQMSALRQQQPDLQPETEVIYLVVPPAQAVIQSVDPLTLMEWMSLLWLRLGLMRTPWIVRSFSEGFMTLSSSVVVTIGALYGLYMLKSWAGIDLIPGGRLEDFAPFLPGWKR